MAAFSDLIRIMRLIATAFLLAILVHGAGAAASGTHHGGDQTSIEPNDATARCAQHGAQIVHAVCCGSACGTDLVWVASPSSRDHPRAAPLPEAGRVRTGFALAPNPPPPKLSARTLKATAR